MLLAFDLGTGGNKAALFDLEGRCLAEAFVAYATSYPHPGWHEQCPEDWWQAVVQSTRDLLSTSNVQPESILACGVSGHSLGAVPMDRSGSLLRKATPLWSDSRAGEQAEKFFQSIPESRWYTITGNGFPPPLYPLFKILWYRDHEPEIFNRIARVIGTKDYINYCLCGFIGTDYSYASGSGVYDLIGWQYSNEFIAASGLPEGLFPEIVPSSQVIGNLSEAASQALGLPRSVKVIAGGVDNSCMALGARNLEEGQVYNSQGSSSWIAVTASRPILQEKTRPFVFTHVIPELFNSAIGVFSTGSSFRWLRDQFCRELAEQAESSSENPYDWMTAEASSSPVGANGLIFHPNMAGGSSIDPSIHLRGALLGMDLRHTRADVIRAAMEGIALQQRVALDILRALTPVSQEMILVGGGSRSKLWRQIHADVYGLRVLKTNIDQNAAALGAAALAAVGSGLWDDFERIKDIHELEEVTDPIPENSRFYEKILPIFRSASQSLADFGDRLNSLL